MHQKLLTSLKYPVFSLFYLNMHTYNIKKYKYIYIKEGTLQNESIIFQFVNLHCSIGSFLWDYLFFLKPLNLLKPLSILVV